MVETKTQSKSNRLIIICVIFILSLFIVFNFDKEGFFRDETGYILTGEVTFTNFFSLDFGDPSWSDWMTGIGYNVTKLLGLVMWIFILSLVPDAAAELDTESLLEMYNRGKIFALDYNVVTAARVPGVILGLISIYVVYSITKRINFNESSHRKGLFGPVLLGTNSII